MKIKQQLNKSGKNENLEKFMGIQGKSFDNSQQINS